MRTLNTHTFPLTPLPDFIEDHTLLREEPTERLREHCARWIQFLTGLWQWFDRAAFCLRYVAGIVPGRVDVFLLATAHEPSEAGLLETNVITLLANHRLRSEACRAAPNLPDPLEELRSPVVLEVTQLTIESLWKPARMGESDGEAVSVYPWWGPGGPFLLPLQALVHQKLPTTLSAFLEPTVLRRPELNWFDRMSAEAETQAEQSRGTAYGGSRRTAVPAAKLASRLYTANFRRLLANPFLVSVQCAVGDPPTGPWDRREKRAAADGVATTIQALVHELPFERPYQEDEHLPSGSNVREASPEATAQYSTLRFRFPNRQLTRVPYLVDAQGAATVFRLPVSVRGGVPGIEVRQLPPEFNPGPRVSKPPAGHIHIGKFSTGGVSTVDRSEFKKHCLITGFTGSGKTFTLLYLLDQFWRDYEIPFLVIESAKSEYRGLITVKDLERENPPVKRQFSERIGDKPVLRIYTLGNELCAPFRLNPFELIPGVRLEAHIGRLQTCFAAALPQEGPLPALIADALILVYTDPPFRWKLTDTGPREPRTDPRRFPRLRDFRDKLLLLITIKATPEFPKGRGYSGELADNLTAFVSGRVSPLLDGSKGRMFDVEYSIPPKELFEMPTVLELNDLNGPDKSLVTMVLLMLLREYRENTKSQSLQHVTVVEEAHNILSRSEGPRRGSDQPDTAGHTVDAFCNMLSEIRALGEGLIIADQSPEKLAPDAMRNTNVQIAHQLRDSHDRDAIANAMLMSDEQRNFVGKVPVGWAAVFYQGLEKATFVKVPEYVAQEGDGRQPGKELGENRGRGFKKQMDDSEVRAHMLALSKDVMIGPLGSRCQPCEAKCDFRERVLGLLGPPEREFFRDWVKTFYLAKGDEELDRILKDLTQFLVTIGSRLTADAAETLPINYCILQHLCEGMPDYEFGPGWLNILRRYTKWTVNSAND